MRTTRTYLTACKQFYEFTGRLHPMQAGKDPAWIEQFYDQLPPDLDTRAARVAGLKYMYRRICEKYGMYPNPFGNYSPLANVYLTSEDHLYCHQRIVAPICHGLQVAGDTAVSLSINACSETA